MLDIYFGAIPAFVLKLASVKGLNTKNDLKIESAYIMGDRRYKISHSVTHTKMSVSIHTCKQI